MKPTNRKKQARPQIRRKKHQLKKHKPSLPAPPAMGKRKEKGRKRKEQGWGGQEEITKEQGKENISESSNQEKNRDGFCFSQQPNALRR